MVRRDLLDKANYYYITDPEIDLSHEEQVRVAVEKGVKIIQYREKSKRDRERYDDLQRIVDLCKDKALLIVNDRVDLALAAGADGVHLGQDDIPPEIVSDLIDEMILGVSTHDLEQAKEYQNIADYVAVGPIRKTRTKEDVEPELGIERAKTIAESIQVPTAAIGGIDENDIESLAGAFDMICAISSVTREGDLSERISYFEKKIDEAKR
ncbi:MAG: thiamine phosphate synthase [Candidatus Natronoplasma sp.]